MALVPYLDVEDMPDPHRHYAKNFEREHGRLPWLRLLGTHYPPFVDAVSRMYPAFMTTGKVDRLTKELIFVACAETRGCRYCMGSHSRHLVQELGLTREQVELARAGDDAPGLTPIQTTLIRFARKVAIDAQNIDAADIQNLRDAGLDDSEIVEVVAVCCFSAFTNTFTDTFKLADDIEMMGMQDEYF